MEKQWVKPFDKTLMWSAIGMSGASLVVLLVGGVLSELLGDKLMLWASLLLMGGLLAPCAGMNIGASTCRPWDDSVSRSTHGFAIGCGILAGSVVAVIELAIKLG